MKTSFLQFKSSTKLDIGNTLQFSLAIIDGVDDSIVESIPFIGSVTETPLITERMSIPPTSNAYETAYTLGESITRHLKTNEVLFDAQLTYGIDPFKWNSTTIDDVTLIVNNTRETRYTSKLDFISSLPVNIILDVISDDVPVFDFTYNFNYSLSGCDNIVYTINIVDGVGPFEIETPYRLRLSGRTANVTIPRGVVNPAICISDMGAQLSKCITITNHPIQYNRDIFNIVFDPEICEITVTPLVDISTLEPLEYTLEGEDNWQLENVISVPTCDPETEILIRDRFGCIMVASINGEVAEYSDVLWVRSPQWVVDDNTSFPSVDEMNVTLNMWSGDFDASTNPTLPINYSLRTIYFNNEASINISDYIRDAINPTMHIDYDDLDNPIRYNDEGVFYSLTMEGANDSFVTGIATLGYGYHEEGYNPHPIGSGININNTSHRYYIDDLVPRTTSFSTVYTTSSSIFWRGTSSNVEMKGIICKKGNYNFGIFYLNKIGLWDFIPFNYYSTQEIERTTEDTYTRKSKNYKYPINMFGKQVINTSTTTKYTLNTPILDASYNERIIEMMNSTRWYLYRNDLDDSYVRQQNPQDWLYLKPVVLTNNNFNLVGGNRNSKYQWTATFELANNLINDIS